MKKVICSSNAPQAVGPYSQAVEAGGLLFISGQLPVDPSSGRMPAPIEEQTRQCFANIGAILTEAGYGLEHIVKATVLLADMDDFAAMNGVYAGFFESDMPARVCYQVAKLPMGAMVEIETIAAK